MLTIKTGIRHKNQRAGTALILAVVMMFTLFGMVAFSVDTGYLAQSRAEAIRAADSASLAGCWELYEHLEEDPQLQVASVHNQIAATADSYAEINPVNKSGPAVQSSDVAVGYLANMRSSALSEDSSLPLLAVRVKLHKNETTNGSVPMFFGRIFGLGSKDLTVQSTSVMSRAISGFKLSESSESNLDVLPFALDLQTWAAMITATNSGSGGQDNYSFNFTTGQVTSGSDGVYEVNLYPQGTGSPGNRGTVDIGHANNSTKDIARQILTGISPADLVALGKPLQLSLDSGTMTLNGDTGISAGVKDELQQIVGQKRIIPIFSSVSGNGNNAVYTICKWAGVRIMYVKLTGSMNSKKLIVQPAPIISSNAIRSTNTSSSDFVLTPVVLAQ